MKKVVLATTGIVVLATAASLHDPIRITQLADGTVLVTERGAGEVSAFAAP